MKDRRTYEPIKASREISTAKLDEVSIKNVLPVAKNMKQLKQWCKIATKRMMGDAVNPFI